MGQQNISMSINGNITQEPKLAKAGNVNVINFTVAVQTNEKETNGDGFITNFYEVIYYPSANDKFMDKAQKGTEVTLYGKGWMYTYFSKKDNCNKAGLKFKAKDYTLHARTKDAVKTPRQAEAEPDYDL